MIYNFKILYSPVKWLCALVFVLMIPIAMYAPTYYDFTNICSIYIPFAGVLMLTDITAVDRDNLFEEIAYVSDKKPAKTFLERYIITATFIIMLVLSANFLFRILQFLSGSYFEEPISLMQHILIVCGASFMLGSISMSVSSATNNIYIGYGVSFIYWIYWNVNCLTESWFNLFPFITSPVTYEKYLGFQWFLIIVMIISNSILARKSPFFAEEIIQKRDRLISFFNKGVDKLSKKEYHFKHSKNK